MIAVDTNLLVYAHRADAVWHEAAVAAIAGLAEGRSAWGIPWPCIHEFLAIVTHPRISRPPTPLVRAIDQVEAWLESPSVVPLGEGADYWPTVKPLLVDGRVAGPVVHDARVAAICLQHGVREFWSADRDFSRFPQLTIRNPLVTREPS